MRWSWTVARVAHINLNVHATFFILLAWIALASYSRTHTPAAAILGILLTIAVFASVVLHELGHALMAKRFGVQTKSITLLPIGGVAKLERIPDEPKQELAIAVAGPAVTLAIIAILFLLLRIANVPLAPAEPSAAAPGTLVAQVMWINVLLLLFNLLPAFPMDGGRVLRAALATRMPFQRATEIAAHAGKVFALVFALAGLFLLNNPLLIVVGAFVWISASAESGAAQFKSAVGDTPVSDVMITDVKTLTAAQSTSAAVDELRAGFQHDFPVVDQQAVSGVLTRENLLKALAMGLSQSSVGDVMETSFATTSPEESVTRAWERLQGCHCRTLPVLRDGELVGLITAEKISEYVMISTARRTNREAA